MDEQGRASWVNSGRVDRSFQTDARAEPARPEGGNASGGTASGGTASGALRELGLAAVGAVALTAERADDLAEMLASRGGLTKEDVRSWIDEASTRWRGDAVRFGERAGATFQGMLRELGLVTRDDWDDLELRVAQLEHRLRLVEQAGSTESS
jgi:polyhydroxyalkanoate synthesis regulator phasin